LNTDPEKGRTGSIQCGLSSILERKGRLPKHVLIVPVDRPGWSVDIIMNLIASSATSSPVWDGRGGHPLLIAGDDVNTVYLADSNAPLSSLIERQKLDVDFPFLHLNIDTEDDLHELDLAAKEDWF
jgi:CTP:molybdopterin cytidylyltransferase MocA